jgi:hypothetical protein
VRAHTQHLIAAFKRPSLLCGTARSKSALLCGGAVFLLYPLLTWAAGVHALFHLGQASGGPFPSDWFTVADPSHNTERRVNLPMPDCAERASDCQDIEVINTLDGFNPTATLICTCFLTQRVTNA